VQDDIGAEAAVEGLHIYDAIADVKYALPSDFVDVVKVLDSDGDLYDSYDVANGYIEFSATDTYELWFKRLPGPLTHKQDDTADVVTTAVAEDEDTLVALVNAEVDAYEAHRPSTSLHVAADNTNAVTESEATDEATAIARLNDLRTQLIAHAIQSGVHVGNDLHLTIHNAAATDAATAYLLANEILYRLNFHLTSGLVHQAYHLAIASYLAYQYRVTQKPDSNHATMLYSRYLAAKADAGLSLGVDSRGADKIRGWW
jgi:hypothetical protein